MAMTVLLVDDQPAAVAQLARWLTGHGCSVLVAENGPQAHAQIRRHQPAVVLIDLLFEDTDAFAWCEELRLSPATATVPVIVMTSLASEMALTPSHARRADAFLRKPCDPVDLFRTIERVLRYRASAFHAPVSPPLCLQESS